MSNNIYCTYLTVYTGNKLPPFYIGSSSVEKINKGYHGSVKSKKYKDIWEEELKLNKNFFRTFIISTHQTREEAINKEKIFQIKQNVVKSTLYINESIAAPNGYFGRDMSGRLNNFYGKTHNSDAIKKISESSSKRKYSDATKQKISKNKKGKKLGPMSELAKQNIKISRSKRDKSVDLKTSEKLKLLWSDPLTKQKFLSYRNEFSYATGKKWFINPETGITIQCFVGSEPIGFILGRKIK